MVLFPAVLASLLVLSSAQTYPECTAEVARSDDCAAVINANACYNKFRWNAQTLTCIDGNDNAVKQKKVSHSTADDGDCGADHGGIRQVCACCSCVGKVMCDWATKQKYC